MMFCSHCNQPVSKSTFYRHKKQSLVNQETLALFPTPESPSPRPEEPDYEMGHGLDSPTRGNAFGEEGDERIVDSDEEEDEITKKREKPINDETEMDSDQEDEEEDEGEDEDHHGIDEDSYYKPSAAEMAYLRKEWNCFRELLTDLSNVKEKYTWLINKIEKMKNNICSGLGNAQIFLKLNQPLYEGAKLKLSDYVQVLLKYKIAHKLNNCAFEQWLKAIALFLPENSLAPTTLYQFKKLTLNTELSMNLDSCSQCEYIFLDDSTESCPRCTNERWYERKLKNGTTHKVPFQQIQYNPITTWLALHVKHDPGFRERLNIPQPQPSNHWTNCVRFQTICEEFPQASSPNSAVFASGVDGVSIYHNLYALLNVVRLENTSDINRNSIDNFYLVSASSKHADLPGYSGFMLPFVFEMIHLAHGTNIQVGDKVETFYGFLLDFIADLDAVRRLICNEGWKKEYACSMCNIQGTSDVKNITRKVKGGTGLVPSKHTMVTWNSTGDHLNIRSNDAYKNGDSPGIQEVSCICGLPGFDIAHSIPFDQMHSKDMRAAATLIEIAPMSIEMKKTIANRVEYICQAIPHAFKGRTPRNPIENKLKASEMRDILSYFSSAFFGGIVDEEWMKTWTRLVNIHNLIQEEDWSGTITNEAVSLIKEIDKMKTRKCTISIHRLLHVDQCGRSFGQLSSHCAYPFENYYGHIATMVFAPKDALKSLSKTLGFEELSHFFFSKQMNNDLKSLISSLRPNFDPLNLSSTLPSHKLRTPLDIPQFPGCFFAGRPEPCQLAQTVIRKVCQCLFPTNLDDHLDFVSPDASIYLRFCVSEDFRVYGSNYQRGAKRNSSWITFLDLNDEIYVGYVMRFYSVVDLNNNLSHVAHLNRYSVLGKWKHDPKVIVFSKESPIQSEIIKISSIRSSLMCASFSDLKSIELHGEDSFVTNAMLGFVWAQ